ncbi:hypothetical protein QEH52_19230 [Coraliomargarita sp. SDUM461003]|uniref:Cyclophilin-like domain-containing protein n=1 Tax=Thalassobacterium maritimum TaxID=3041265 RepID=A0ABU1B252_9BACT|nr:hypothetical protein [Coraliomargarita sp. SDUM461003]MDQ8209660.1 hypothetical protein [Coraliomargarita sp. SDUM461003]
MKIASALIALIAITSTLSADTELESDFEKRVVEVIESRDFGRLHEVLRIEGNSRMKLMMGSSTFERAMLLGYTKIEVKKIERDSPYWPKQSVIDGSTYVIDEKEDYWTFSILYEEPKHPIIGLSKGSTTILAEYDGHLYVAAVNKQETIKAE